METPPLVAHFEEMLERIADGLPGLRRDAAISSQRPYLALGIAKTVCERARDGGEDPLEAVTALASFIAYVFQCQQAELDENIRNPRMAAIIAERLGLPIDTPPEQVEAALYAQRDALMMQSEEVARRGQSDDGA